MDEARSLQYSIEVKTNIEKAEQDIQSLISQCGKLRAEASGGIDINADVDIGEAAENIRELTEDIGDFRADAGAGVVINADTERAEENVRELTEGIGSIETGTVEVDVDTEEAQDNVKRLAERVTNLGHDPPDIKIDADTSEAERNIRDLTDDIGDLSDDASSIGSAFRKSFLAGVDSGNSFASSLRSGVGGAITYAGEKVTEFKDNVVTRMKGAADNVVSLSLIHI